MLASPPHFGRRPRWGLEMPELKLGTKFECFNCGTKFYDLGKPEAVCPKCGANQKDSLQAEAPAVSQTAKRKRKAEVVKPVEPVEEEAEPIDELPVDELETPEIDSEVEEEEEDIDDEG
jgi:uncharacterized protein (TIGR02300 family)